MSRLYHYTSQNEFMLNEFPEIQPTTLEDIENERLLDLENDEEVQDNFFLPPEQPLRFE